MERTLICSAAIIPFLFISFCLFFHPLSLSLSFSNHTLETWDIHTYIPTTYLTYTKLDTHQTPFIPPVAKKFYITPTTY
ncbi:hypothetical protein F4809DRAFT_624077 [Biscogniauxia mediterranea]|nr:hypothetical protein F4809DRAFT_624077 [Biscogniauxia mediterranea]